MIHRNSDDLHFQQILTLLRRRWLLVTTIGVLGGGLAAAAGFILPPKYTAKAQLLYQAEMQDGVEVVDDAAVETLVEMMISPTICAAWPPVWQRTRVRRSGARRPTRLRAVPRSQAKALPSHGPVLDQSELEGGLNAYKQRQSRLIAVTFNTTDPETAALVANRAVTLYLSLEAQHQRERRARAAQLVTDRIPDAREKLESAESALRAHRARYGLSDAPGADLTDRQIAELTRQLMIARSDLAERDAHLERLRLGAADGRGGAAEDADPPSRRSRAAGDIQVAAITNADVLDASGSNEAQSDPPDRLTPSATASERMALDRDAAAARLGDIEARLSILQQASTKMTQSWTVLRELEREASAAGQSYENLLKRQADLLGDSGVRPAARLVTTAAVPDQPSSPIRCCSSRRRPSPRSSSAA